MQAVFDVYFLGLKRYDKKDKKTKEKTGEQGNILQVLEIKSDKSVVVSTYFPSDEQIKCDWNELGLMDKVRLLFDVESANSKPKLVELQCIVEKATINYKPVKV